jgi:hypothetical protein
MTDEDRTEEDRIIDNMVIDGIEKNIMRIWTFFPLDKVYIIPKR